MEQKEYWDSVSDTKVFSTPFQIEEFSKHVEKNQNIVDVGCGYGRTLKELYNYGYKNLIGIDFSKGMIERGRKELPNVDFRVKENSKIDMPDNSVDAVILFAVLTCIIKNEEQEELMSEIYRILKPNGVVYINDFLLNDDERNLNRYKKFENKYGQYGVFELPEGAIVRHHSKDRIHKLLKNFNVIKFEDLTFTTMNGNKSNGFYCFAKK